MGLFILIYSRENKFFLLDISQYNIDAIHALKSVLWEGTEHWDELLKERAAMSGRLVLSPETKSQLAPYKQSNQ